MSECNKSRFCLDHNNGRTMWVDENGMTHGHRCTCHRRRGERRKGRERISHLARSGKRVYMTGALGHETDRRQADRRKE